MGLGEIAEEMQHYMDKDSPDFADRLTEIARYLKEQDHIRDDPAYHNTIILTATGVRELEREAAPESTRPTQYSDSTAPSTGRREKRYQFLEAIYDLAGGSPNQFVYWPTVAPRLGWDAENWEHLKEALDYADYLAASGLISIVVDEGTIYRVTPAGIDEVEKEGAQSEPVQSPNTRHVPDDVAKVEEAPLHIRESLQRFREDHPDPTTVAFILMQFRDTKAHGQIAKAIKEGLAAHGITGVRADDKEYHEDLFPNIVTYMHGCGMGVAVFERIEAENFNPNVSLEMGYMYAMGKPLCLLKDRTLTALHTDLMGKLYREFDPYDPGGTIPPRLSRWLNDRGLSKR